MDSKDLGEVHLNGLSIVERVSSVFSLLGCLLIISTFFASKSFHKPVNRLVFYASFGNMMTNVASLMARSYMNDPISAGCQFQAFLIQMFMPADALWTLAMAVNVYLTFYYKFDAQKLRRMEVPYLFFCYGVPFVVSITYVFVRNQERGRMYGDAILWCWISSRWDIWRIATFYGPVWVIILVTFFIYARAGRDIYMKHKQLRNFRYDISSNGFPEAEGETGPPLADNNTASKTTEVVVVTETIQNHQDIDLTPLGRRTSTANAVAATSAAYSVTISSDRRLENLGPPDALPSDDGDGLRVTRSSSRPPTSSAVTAATRNPASQRLRHRALYEANSAAWSYAKCALLFFTALLVTWIPSSANRVYSVMHINSVSVPLEYMSAFVLPLQGFWNAIIYVVTSWKACVTLWGEITSGFDGNSHRGRRRTSHPGGNRQQCLHHLTNDPVQKSHAGNGSADTLDRNVSAQLNLMMVTSHGRRDVRNKPEKTYETESVRELTVSRSQSLGT